MASSTSTCLLLITAIIATSYLSLAAANLINLNITSIALPNGRVFCTTNGNPNLSCGGTSCPPAVNAIVRLAIPNSNTLIAQTTTNSTGFYSFNLIYNATNPSPVSLLNSTLVNVYVSIPVSNCTALAGAGILRAPLLPRNNFTAGGVAVTYTPLLFMRV